MNNVTVRCLLWFGLLSVGTAAVPVQNRSWADVDALRWRLERNGVRMSQVDCQRGLQGANDSRRNKLVVCRAHRSPGQVWNTLADEAAHRMQDCAGGAISKPEYTQTMLNILRRYSLEDVQHCALNRDGNTAAKSRPATRHSFLLNR